MTQNDSYFSYLVSKTSSFYIYLCAIIHLRELLKKKSLFPLTFLTKSLWFCV